MTDVLEARRVRVLVLGGGYAGVLATVRMAKRLAGRGEVTLVNDRPDFVQRIRLHQLAVGQRLASPSIEHLLRKTGARLLVGRATEIDPGARTVAITTAGGPLSLPYDYLVYALGSGSGAPPIEGLVEHTYQVATEDDARRFSTRLEQCREGDRVTVVGAGLTGVELSTEIAEARPDLRVTLLTSGSLASDLSTAGAAALARAMTELSITVREHTTLASVASASIRMADGEEIDSNLTAWCGGFFPNALARSSGLPTMADGRLAVDGHLRSIGAPEIFGAGDGVGLAADEARYVRMGCVTALPLGAAAADNVVATIEGAKLEPFGFGFFARCISLGRRRGIIQRVTSDDQPMESVITGRLGAKIKEGVCRFTLAALAMERLFPGTYSWPKRHVPILPGSTSSELAANIG
jgi:NADH dehydrogenase FAD-containing subunit